MTLSFDDADQTLSSVVQPLLDERGIRAIAYIPTDYVLQGVCYRIKSRPPTVSWDQLGRWLEAGHEIGGHTHTHPRLDQCTAQQQLEELTRSADLIYHYLGFRPVHLAYPWGRFTDQTCRLVSSMGPWQSAVTVDIGWNTSRTNRFKLFRSPMDAAWPASHINFRLAIGSSRALECAYRCYRAAGLNRLFPTRLRQ